MRIGKWAAVITAFGVGTFSCIDPSLNRNNASTQTPLGDDDVATNTPNGDDDVSDSPPRRRQSNVSSYGR